LEQNRIYNELAHLWPLISPQEDGAKEAGYWRNVLIQKLGPGRHSILSLGAGGGSNISHLTDTFDATAVDISQNMLDNSMKLNPTVEHHIGDMRSVRLETTFRAVLIHDAISYMVTEEDIKSTFVTAKAHLNEGGILIVAPEWYAETFPGTYVSSRINTSADQEVTLVQYIYDKDKTDTTIESIFFYMLKDDNGLRIEQDLHVTGLFSLDRWLDLMLAAGFEPEKWVYPTNKNETQSYLLVGVLKTDS
jgi:hypothetical protein